MTPIPRRRTPQDPDACIADLADNLPDINKLAQQHNLSPAALLRWTSAQPTLNRIDRHNALYNSALRLALSRAAVRAVAALLDRALDASSPETARKACVDCIKLAPDSAQHPPSAPTQPPENEDELLRALTDKLTTPAEHIDH